MTPDASHEFYDAYFARSNRFLELTLKDGYKITGVFVSFVPGEKQLGEPYIIRWRMVETTEKFSSLFEFLENNPGQMIEQKDIASVKFMDDGSVMNF